MCGHFTLGVFITNEPPVLGIGKFGTTYVEIMYLSQGSTNTINLETT